MKSAVPQVNIDRFEKFKIMVVRLDLMLENNEILYQFPLLFYDFEILKPGGTGAPVLILTQSPDFKTPSTGAFPAFEAPITSLSPALSKLKTA